MTRLTGIPPGRAGRMRLRERLRGAERGVELLDAKLRVLRGEQLRYHLAAERTGEQWQTRAAEAHGWLLRAALLGGQRSLRLVEDVEPADVRISWTVVMGARYPKDAELRGGGSGPAAALSGTGALPQAAAAHVAALEAAARHAVAEAAVRRIDGEVAETHRRLRAVQDRWIPRLTADLREIEAGLEELEHAEGVRLRWVVGRRADPPEDTDEEVP